MEQRQKPKDEYTNICETCKSTIMECSFCRGFARHLLEGKDITKDVYFCDQHLMLVAEIAETEALHVLNPGIDVNMDSEHLESLELGMYMPGPEGCTCDSWR